MKSARPRFYFSFRSPYAWLAARVLRARGAAGFDRLERIPYWEPDEDTAARLAVLGGKVVYVPMTRQKHLYILQDVKRLTRSLGIEHVWPIDERPRWDVPHLAYLAAERLGRDDDFLWACFRARWEQGRDVCRRNTMATLEQELGLPAGVLAEAPADPALLDAGARLLLRAWNDGVFGIPFFVAGAQKFWGVDRLEGFLAALEGREHAYLAGARTGREDAQGARDDAHRATSGDVPAAVLAAAATCDEDHAGGCG